MDSSRSATDEGKHEKITVLSGGSFVTNQAMHDDILRRNQIRESMSKTLGGYVDFSEAQQLREIEKQRIKEEFIMGGILRRRELEMEVMEELMMERNKYSLVDFQSPMLQSHSLDSIRRYRNYFPCNERLSSMGSHRFDRSLLAMNGLEEGGPSSRVSIVEMSEKTSLVNRVEGEKDIERSVEEHPFQRRREVSSDKVAKPVIDLKSGPNLATVSVPKPIIDLKSGPNLATVSFPKPIIDLKSGPNLVTTKAVSCDGVGTKRKLETPVIHKSNETTAKKAYKRCWDCSLCQVSANSERVLKDHLNGKMHKAKEKARKFAAVIK